MEKNTQQMKIGANGRLIIKAAITGGVITLVLILLSSALMSYGKIPEGHEALLVSASLFLGSLAAGIISTKKKATGKLVCALASGAIILAIIILAAMAINGANPISGRMVANATTILVGVICGGVITSAKKERRRHSK